jgi:hypothetical protein
VLGIDLLPLRIELAQAKAVVTALSLFSSFMTRLKASSMQTWTNSQHRVQMKPTLLLR